MADQGFDSTKPNVARIYDYLLGGKEHFAADRAAAEQLLTALPNAAALARANRVFLAAAVRRVAGEGIAQYLDVGAGLPTSPSVHASVREVIPDARVVYVDNDPVAVTHAKALLATRDGVSAVRGDAREPRAILDDPAVTALIDLSRPVCVLLVSVLHFFTAQEADGIVAVFRERMVPGSYLVISQGVVASDPGQHERVKDAYGSQTLTGRTTADIAAYFDGFDLLPPGLVPIAEWPGYEPQTRLPWRAPGPADTSQASMVAAVGRKRLLP
jgi:hypothetical protein